MGVINDESSSNGERRIDVLVPLCIDVPQIISEKEDAKLKRRRFESL